MEQNIQQGLTGWEDFREPEEITDKELASKLLVVDDKIDEVLETIEETLTKIKVPSKPVDRFGTCPNCKASWDGGDIYEELLKKGILSVNIGDAKKAAGMYGWTETDKKRFSTLLTYELETGIFVECPNCNHLFNQDTSKEYESLFDVKQIGK